MPNGKGYKNQDDAKSQPAKLSDRDRENQADGNYNGYLHPFNEGQKVTNTKGSSYQDFGGGISDNFDEKDANLEELKNRNMNGQLCNYWTATKRTSMETGVTGPTAYNSDPIPETYTPATSQDEPNANAVEYNTIKKNRY